MYIFNKKKVSIIFCLLFILSFIIFTGSYAVAKNPELKLYSSNKSGFDLSFSYPKDWMIQERGSSEITPFAVVISDVDMNYFHAVPGRGYPDKAINIVFYKTNDTEDQYVQKELKEPKIKKVESKEIFSDYSGNIRVYKSDSLYKKGSEDTVRYLSAYKKYGEYLVIIESQINKLGDEKEVEDIFSNVISTIKFGK